MNYVLLISRGSKIRKQRISRGLTQVQLANLAGLTRYKIIVVEKGAPSVSMIAYPRTLAALSKNGDSKKGN
ncbi:transcriptional regulator [Pseudomonas fluorescens]|uniref:Transcriptional regulator n=1 Tax=Pseudomonas fluorescens TaxID=294 RepID=A0A345V3U2_PSEFL|nr:transcriptional regulator [Pseudomonas fluorescens]AXJ07394.1 transcriptional regulator [Pseudomonas fluorescens]